MLAAFKDVIGLTRRALHKLELLNERWIVDDPASLPGVVSEMIQARN